MSRSARSDDSLTVLVHMADQRRDRTDSHGIINFSVGLVRALPSALAPDERLVVTANETVADELREGGVLRTFDRVVIAPVPTTARRLWVDHVDVLRHVRRTGADVVLYPKGFLPAIGPSVPQVVCLHDDIPVRARDHAPSMRRRVRASYFTALLRHSMKRADARLYVSAFTAERLRRLVDGSGPWDRVVHEGITLPLRRPASSPKNRRALVFGSHHPHKRIAAGLDLARRSAALADHVDEIVVAGSEPPESGDGGLPVRWMPGPFGGDEIATVLAESRVLLFPSEYEGFGLPPVEALALGTPCVYRGTGAADEILADVPGRFDEESQVAFDRAVSEALSLDDAELASLGDRMVTTFDWCLVAERVAEVLRGVSRTTS